MPKLTLRDLFAVVTILAVLAAWWVDHRRLTGRKILPVPKLALRDLFSIVAIVALGLGWSLDHYRQTTLIERLRMDLHAAASRGINLKDERDVLLGRLERLGREQPGPSR